MACQLAEDFARDVTAVSLVQVEIFLLEY